MMALILRYCILNQKKWITQEFRLFHHNVSSHTYINSNIKKFGSILCTKHFSTENEKIHIYKGRLTKRVRNLKVFSWTTSIISLFIQPFIYMKAVEDDNLASVGIALAFINLMVTASPLVVHLLIKRYVTNMYYYPEVDIFVAEVFGLFLKKKLIVFRSNEIDVDESPLMVRNCKVNGHPLLFDEQDFIDSKYYCILMRYNEPIDFEMGPGAVKQQQINMASIRERLKDSEKEYQQIKSK